MEKKVGLRFFAGLMAGVLCLTTSFAGDIVVADFDSGDKPTNIGTDLGTWDKAPSDDSQSCNIVFNGKERHGDSGYSLQIDYDVESVNPAFNGLWLALGDLDVSRHQYLTFWLKGDSEGGYTRIFKVELKGATENGYYYVGGIRNKWKKFWIPLKFFKITDMSALKELLFIFEDHAMTQKKGILYIDDIVFEEKK